MGQMTFTEYKSALTFELGNRDDLSSYTGDWINRAYRTLTTQNQFFGQEVRTYFPELETSSTDTTADGTATVSVPSDAFFIRTIWDSTSDRKLKNIGWKDYIDFTGRASSSARSAPTMWTRRGSYIYFYPTPDAAYGVTIYYRKHITEMSADTSTTEIGEEWDEAVLKLAVIQSMKRLKMYEQAKSEEEVFIAMANGVASAYEKEAEDREDKRYPDVTWMTNNYR